MREGVLRKKDLGLLAVTQPADDSHTSTTHVPHLLCELNTILPPNTHKSSYWPYFSTALEGYRRSGKFHC